MSQPATRSAAEDVKASEERILRWSEGYGPANVSEDALVVLRALRMSRAAVEELSDLLAEVDNVGRGITLTAGVPIDWHRRRAAALQPLPTPPAPSSD